MVRKHYKRASRYRTKRIKRSNRSRKHNSRYTAYIPKTIRATTKVRNYTLKRGKFFVKSMKNTFKNISKNIDNQTAKFISTLKVRV